MEEKLFLIDPESGMKIYVTKQDWIKYHEFMASLTPKNYQGTVQIMGISDTMNNDFKKLWMDSAKNNTQS